MFVLHSVVSRISHWLGTAQHKATVIKKNVETCSILAKVRIPTKSDSWILPAEFSLSKVVEAIFPFLSLD